MGTLAELRRENTHHIAECVRVDGWLGESDTRHNDRQRAIIAALKAESGQAWLGKINLHNDEDRARVMWPCDDPAAVYNFDASFVVPVHSARLEQLIRDRDVAPYTGTKDDARRLEPIMAEIEALGGVHLIWT